MASYVNKKSVGGSSGRSGGGIVGAIVPPKKKIDNFPLMSYVANNCSFSDKGEESLEDEEVLKAYNDQRVNDLLSEAAKAVVEKRKDDVSDDSEDRKKALEVLRSMEWSKNQEETWKVVKSKKDTDYGDFLHPLHSKRNVKEDDYFSGINTKVKKPKERKRSRSVSEVVVLDNGTLVPKNNPSQELPIKLNHPPRPVIPRVPSVGLPFTPGPPPSTANNQWLQKSGSTLFPDSRSNTIVAYGINCDEEQAMALAIAESIRTAKVEQARILNFVNPSVALPVLPKSNMVSPANAQPKFDDAISNDNECSQMEASSPKPKGKQPAKDLQDHHASKKSELSNNNSNSDANNNSKLLSSWEDATIKTEGQTLGQRSKYSAQVPAEPLIFLKSACDNAQKKSVKAPDAADNQSQFSDCWKSAEQKYPAKGQPKQNSTSDAFQKILSNSYKRFDGKIDTTSPLSPFSKKDHTLREHSSVMDSFSEEINSENGPKGVSHVPETFSQVPLSTTVAKTTHCVRKLALEPNPIVGQAETNTDSSYISAVKHMRSDQDSVASTISDRGLENQFSGTTMIPEQELAQSVAISSHNNIPKPSKLLPESFKSAPSLPTSVRMPLQTSTSEIKTQVPDPYIRRHRHFVIHSEIPGRTTNASIRSPAEKGSLAAEAAIEPQPLTEATTRSENVDLTKATVPAQQNEQMPQQSSAVSPILPSLNHPVAGSMPLNRIPEMPQQSSGVPPILPSLNHPVAASMPLNRIPEMPQQSSAVPPVLTSLNNPVAASMPFNKIPEMAQAQDMASLLAAQQQQIQLQYQMMLMQQAMGFIPPVLPSDQSMAGVRNFGQQDASQNQAENQTRNLSFPGSLNPSLAGIHGLPNTLPSNMPGYPAGALGGIHGMPNPLAPSLLNPLSANMLGLPNGYPTGFPMMPNPIPGAQPGIPPMPGLLNGFPNSIPGLPNVPQGNQAGRPDMVPGSMNTFPSVFSGHVGYPNMMNAPGVQNNLNRPSIPGMLSANSFNGLSSLAEPGRVPLVSKGRGRLARNPTD